MNFFSSDGLRRSVGHVCLQCGNVWCAVCGSSVKGCCGKCLLEVISDILNGLRLASCVGNKLAPVTGGLLLCFEEGNCRRVAGRSCSVKALEPLSPFSTARGNDVSRHGGSLVGIFSAVAKVAKSFELSRVLEFKARAAVLACVRQEAEPFPVTSGWGRVHEAVLKTVSIDLPSASFAVAANGFGPRGAWWEESRFPGDQFVV